MGCVQLATPEEQVRQLTETVKKFAVFAMAHMEWEAMALNDESPWFDEMPEEIMAKFEEVQRLRNEAMPL